MLELIFYFLPQLEKSIRSRNLLSDGEEISPRGASCIVHYGVAVDVAAVGNGADAGARKVQNEVESHLFPYSTTCCRNSPRNVSI